MGGRAEPSYWVASAVEADMNLRVNVLRAVEILPRDSIAVHLVIQADNHPLFRRVELLVLEVLAGGHSIVLGVALKEVDHSALVHHSVRLVLALGADLAVAVVEAIETLEKILMLRAL